MWHSCPNYKKHLWLVARMALKVYLSRRQCICCIWSMFDLFLVHKQYDLWLSNACRWEVWRIFFEIKVSTQTNRSRDLCDLWLKIHRVLFLMVNFSCNSRHSPIHMQSIKWLEMSWYGLLLFFLKTKLFLQICIFINTGVKKWFF